MSNSQGEVDQAHEWFYSSGGARLGPVTQDEMVSLIGLGKINRADLVWHKQLPDWKPAAETELWPADSKTEPPPLPSSHVDDRVAWTLVAIPVAGALVERVLTQSYGPIPFQLAFLAYFVINSALILWDAIRIEKSGRNPKAINLRLWFWLVPLYLFKRARVLGHKLHYFAAWCAAFVVSTLVSQPEIFASSTYWGVGIPKCDSGYARTQVKEIFRDIPLVKFAGLHAAEVRDIREINETESIRWCAAVVRASNDHPVNVAYSIERQDNDFFIRVNVEPPR